jgi:hypothetical protein
MEGRGERETEREMRQKVYIHKSIKHKCTVGQNLDCYGRQSLEHSTVLLPDYSPPLAPLWILKQYNFAALDFELFRGGITQ